MLVKTFEGINYKDTIKHIKQEFGKDAVILSTKEQEDASSGLKSICIKAAIPEAITSPQKNESFSSLSEISPLSERIKKVEELTKEIYANQVTKSDIDGIYYSLNELKQFLYTVLKEKTNQDLKHVKIPIAKIIERLDISGVRPSYQTEVLNYLKSLPEEKRDHDSDYYNAQAMRWMIKRIKISPKLDHFSGSTSIHALVGPPGCGKTTGILKLAAYHIRHNKMKVKILSCDHERVGGSESLKSFANILNIPFANVDSHSDIENLVSKDRDIDLFLIDTPNINPKNSENMNTLKNLLKGSTPIESHLILSLNCQSEFLNRMVNVFGEIGISSLIFSHLDDTWSYGDLFNLSYHYQLPLSFFLKGTEVPNDIEKATRERVIERLFDL